jgi:hypothetical protein
VPVETPKMGHKDSHKDIHHKPVEEKKREKFAKDLLTQANLFNLVFNLIKDLKNDHLQILVSQHTATLLEAFKSSFTDLHKLTEEQIAAVKESMYFLSGHRIIKELQDDKYSDIPFSN